MKSKNLFSNIKRRVGRNRSIRRKTSAPVLKGITTQFDKNRDKALIREFEVNSESLIDSVLRPGGADLSINGISAQEVELRSSAERYGQKLLADPQQAKAAYEYEKQELEKQLEAETPEQRKNRHLTQGAPQLNQDLAGAETPASQKKSLIQKQKEATRKKENAEFARDKTLNKRYQGIPPKRGLRLKAYLLFVALLLPVEAILNYFAIDALPDGDLPPLFIAPTAATTSLILAGAGHFLGSILAGRLPKLLALAPASVLLIILSVIFYVRLDGAESAFVLVFINLASIILVTLMSYLLHRDDEYFHFDQEATKWANEEVRLGIEINEIPKAVETGRQNVYDIWNSRTDALVAEEIRFLESNIAACQKAISECDTYMDLQIIRPLEAAYRDAVCRIRLNILQTRKKNGRGFTTDLPSIMPLSCSSGIKHLPENGTSQNGHDKGKNSLFPIAVGLIMSLLMGCIEPVPLHQEGVFIGDATIEQVDSASLPAVESQVAFLLTSLGFEATDDNHTTVTRNAFRVRITHIDQTSFPAIDEVVMGEGQSLLTMVKSKRRKAQERFVEQVKEAVDHHSRPEGLRHSKVGACLCEVLSPLDRSADNISVLIVSDMILNDPDIGENFYRRAASLMDNYEVIAQKLDGQCPALKGKSLNQVKFTAVYLPKAKEDVVARLTRQFWTRYLKSKGADIEFRPTLTKVKGTGSSE